VTAERDLFLKYRDTHTPVFCRDL